jgi:hypothetical protein
MRAWTLFVRLCVLCACVLCYSFFLRESNADQSLATDSAAEQEGSRRLRRSGAKQFYIYTGEGFEYSTLLDCVPHWNTNQESQHTAEIWMYLLAFTHLTTHLPLMPYFDHRYRQMLQHPLRTLDPDRAGLFYVPVFLHLSYFARSCKGSSHEQRLRATARSLHNSLYFQRNGGHDHTLVSNYWNISGASQPHLKPLLQNFSIGW